MLTKSPTITEKDTEALVNLLAIHDPDSIQKAAALIKKSEPWAMDFIDQNDEAITAEALRIAMTGEALEAKARRFAVKVLDRFDASLDDMDVMEAADLLKQALRIIENADRVKLAQKDPFADLPVTNIRINLIHATKPATKAMQVDTVDVQAVEVRQ